MTIPEFQRHKRDKKKLIVVTAYDALFTRIVEQAGIEAILVGDSLGVVVQGKANTLSVTMDDMLYHTKLVAGAAQRALVIGDMPFMSYQASHEDALRNAGRFLQAGAQAVKLEGGALVVDRVAAMTSIGIPVMGHLGMTPQSVHRYGGYKVQGKESDHALVLLNDAKALEAAGAFAIVLEAIPAELAKTITE
jgi:3-methyl-2-oxobutanoate hydroxymethyltransferase